MSVVSINLRLRRRAIRPPARAAIGLKGRKPPHDFHHSYSPHINGLTGAGLPVRLAVLLPYFAMTGRYGRYEVQYMLGQGAMAKVFLDRDPVLSRLVAVKVLHAELASRKDVLQRFFNEARTVAAVRNPHVVEVFDFGQE